MCFSGVTPRKILKSSTKAVLANGIPARLWLRWKPARWIRSGALAWRRIIPKPTTQLNGGAITY